jgi:hypothetical protein
MYRPVLKNYSSINRQTLTIERRFDLPSYAVAEEPATESGSPAFFEFSAVGFDPTTTRAIVYMGYVCGDLCGSGEIYILVQKNGKWQRDHEFRGRSCRWVA